MHTPSWWIFIKYTCNNALSAFIHVCECEKSWDIRTLFIKCAWILCVQGYVCFGTYAWILLSMRNKQDCEFNKPTIAFIKFIARKFSVLHPTVKCAKEVAQQGLPTSWICKGELWLKGLIVINFTMNSFLLLVRATKTSPEHFFASIPRLLKFAQSSNHRVSLSLSMLSTVFFSPASTRCMRSQFNNITPSSETKHSRGECKNCERPSPMWPETQPRVAQTVFWMGCVVWDFATYRERGTYQHTCINEHKSIGSKHRRCCIFCIHSAKHCCALFASHLQPLRA